MKKLEDHYSIPLPPSSHLPCVYISIASTKCAGSLQYLQKLFTVHPFTILVSLLNLRRTVFSLQASLPAELECILQYENNHSCQ